MPVERRGQAIHATIGVVNRQREELRGCCGESVSSLEWQEPCEPRGSSTVPWGLVSRRRESVMLCGRWRWALRNRSV